MFHFLVTAVAVLAESLPEASLNPGTRTDIVPSRCKVEFDVC